MRQRDSPKHRNHKTQGEVSLNQACEHMGSKIVDFMCIKEEIYSIRWKSAKERFTTDFGA